MLSPSSPYPLPILSIAPLIGDKRCYGEVTARIRGGPGEEEFAAALNWEKIQELLA